MKIKYVKSASPFRALSAREVDELINSSIVKPIATAKKTTDNGVFNNWDLPIESRPYLRCKKYDPL